LPKRYNCYTIKVVRFKFDLKKSNQLKRNPKRGIGCIEAQRIWEQPYYLDQRSEIPEQYRAIGWFQGRFFSVIFEIREDAEGEFYQLVTLWKSTKEEQKLYEKNG